MYDIGEKPGKGTYVCTKCGWRVTLDDHDDRLPHVANAERAKRQSISR